MKKTKEEQDLLAKLASGTLDGMVGDERVYRCLLYTSYRYRNKMEYTFGNLEKGGEMTLGMHKRGQYMTILNVDECQLVHEDFNVIVRAVLDFCRQREYRHYHKKKHDGLMRNLIIRRRCV